MKPFLSMNFWTWSTSLQMRFEVFFFSMSGLSIVKVFQNLSKAISLFTKAVEFDNENRCIDAYHLYCEGLQYFIPLIGSETNNIKKQQLRDKANVYLKRAEEIKQNSKIVSNAHQNISRQQSETNASSNIAAALVPASQYNQLCNIFRY